MRFSEASRRRRQRTRETHGAPGGRTPAGRQARHPPAAWRHRAQPNAGAGAGALRGGRVDGACVEGRREHIRRGYIAATLARRGRTRSAPSCLVVFRRFGSLLGVHAAWSGPARGVARACVMSGASPALCPLFAALSKKQLRGSPLRAEGEYTVPRNRPVRLRFVLGRISERFWCLQTIVKPPSFTGHRVLVRLSHHSGGFVWRYTWGLIDPAR